MTPQQMPEITAIGLRDRLFFKCPMGGYASLHPGFCPKCNESLVPILEKDPAVNVQRTDVVARTEEVFANDPIAKLSVKTQLAVRKQTLCYTVSRG